MNITHKLIILIIMLCLSFSCAHQTTPTEKVKPVDNSVGKNEPKSSGVLNDPEVKRLLDALEMNQSASGLYYDLGQRYMELKRADLAQEQFTKTLEIDPNNTKYIIALADSLADQGKVKRAEEFYMKTLEKEPNNATAHNSLGTMFFRMGRLDQAEEEFKKVVDSDPDHVKALYNLALVNSIKDKNLEAEKLFLRVKELDPERVEVLQHLAKLAFQRKDWDKCKSYAEDGLSKKEIADFVYYIARVQFEKKDYKSAKEGMEKFLTMNYIGPLEADARAILLEIKKIEEKQKK